jgi:dTDP-4-dehydrorhamnose 3,5-epimerase
MDRLNIDSDIVLGIGDSSSYLTFMSSVGFIGCPSNATKPVRRFVLSKHGYCSSFETTEGMIDILRHFSWARARGRTAIFGVSLRHTKMLSDERGKLIQSFHGTDRVTYVSFYELETEIGFLQANHYHPAETKEELIRVTKGQFTVYLEDLRDDSPTKGVRKKIILRSTDPRMLRVPSGVAHALVNTGKELAIASVHSTKCYQPGHDIDYEVLPSVGYWPKTD